MGNFDDIRPYTDDEIPVVMDRLARNDLLVATMRQIKWPNCPKFLIPTMNWLVRFGLKQTFKSIKSIDDFQQNVTGKSLVPWVISSSITELTHSGLEELDPNLPYIFISNHRDIVLDSALVNFIVNQQLKKVPYIAFGDNLLINQLVTDLIKVNRAFIVKRDLPPKEQLKALKHLSEYISSLRERGDHFWIAQREGRAKDGIDITNPAIVKMFYLSERKKQPDFGEFIRSCHIVPIAISYEKDPCDRLKAWELYRKSKRGYHKKRKNEDFISMTVGIVRDKGRVHIAFGKPLSGDYKNEKEVSVAIDQVIHQQYRLWPWNYIAYDVVNQTDKYAKRYTDREKDVFLSRFDGLPRAVADFALKSYANPVFSREGLNSSSED